MKSTGYVCLALAGLLCSAGVSQARTQTAPAGELRESYTIEVQGFVPPESERQPLPYYDEELRRVGVQGTVTLQGRIDDHGKVRDLSVVSGHPLLARAARQAVEKWSYVPARVDDKAIELPLKVTVEFSLQQWPAFVAAGSGSEAKQARAGQAGVVTAVAVVLPPGLER